MVTSKIGWLTGSGFDSASACTRPASLPLSDSKRWLPERFPTAEYIRPARRCLEASARGPVVLVAVRALRDRVCGNPVRVELAITVARVSRWLITGDDVSRRLVLRP